MKKKTILLIDDERNIVVPLRDLFEHEGFHIITARSSEEGLRKLSEAQPDLIVLDINMPGMGGTGFLRHITNADGEPRYPVLVLTARSSMQGFFEETAVAGFLAKPCDERKLLSEVRRILQTRSTPDPRRSREDRRVLLGEPDPTKAAELRRSLEQNGYTIELATDGPAVLQQAAVAPPGLILLREIMPKLNGAAVATLLAGMGSTAAIPVVLYEEGDIAGVDGAHARLTTHHNVRGRFTTTSPHILLDALKTLL